VYITVINSCLKTLQTPAEEIKLDVLVVCYIVSYIHRPSHSPTFDLWTEWNSSCNFVQLCFVQRSNVW